MSWQGIALGCRVLAQETSHDDAFSFGVGAVDDPMCPCQCRDSESISHTWWLRRWRRGRIQQRAGQQYRDWPRGTFSHHAPLRKTMVWIQHVSVRPGLSRLQLSTSGLSFAAELRL